MSEPTIEHLHLAGMALAHAVWSIEDGETLCTMSMLDEHGERSLTRYESDTIPESVEAALGDLKDRLTDGAFAALVYDGYFTDDDGDRRDALIVELVAASPPGSEKTAAHLGRIAQRYEPASGGIFRRKRLKLLGKPLVFDFPDATAGRVIEGALDHEKVRDLFQQVA